MLDELRVIRRLKETSCPLVIEQPLVHALHRSCQAVPTTQPAVAVGWLVGWSQVVEVGWLVQCGTTNVQITGHAGDVQTGH